MRSTRSLLLSSLLVICLGPPASAQTSSGWIRGVVKAGSTFSSLEGASVALRDGDGNTLLQVKTDVAGEFTFLGLPDGVYELAVAAKGYLSYLIRSVQTRDGSTSVVRLNLDREPPGAPATVELAWQGEPSDPWSSDLGSRFGRLLLDKSPSARNVWALLQNQDLPSVTDHIDEGGFHTGTPALVGDHGLTWTQNGYRWNGMNITNPHSPGRPLAYPAFGAIEEFRVSGAYHSAEISAPGAEFRAVGLAGSSRPHGRAEAYYLGDPLQSSNLDSRLTGFGFQTTPHFRQFPEGEIALCAPVPGSTRWSFFSSLGIQHLSRVIPDFAATPATSVYAGILRLDGRLRPQDSLSMLVSGQIARNSNLDAAPGIAPSSTLQGDDRYEQVQGHWTHRRTDTSVYNLDFGFSHASPTDTLQPGITSSNYTRLFTGEMTGAAPLESDSALSRFSLSGRMEALRNTGKSLQHQLAFGLDLEESLATEEQRVFQGLQLYLFPGDAPSEVAEFNSPSHAEQRLREFSLFASDHLQVGGRLFLRFGLNLDSSNAFLPSQVSGAGAFVPVRTFGGRSSVVSWTSLSPRVGLTIPLGRRHGETRFTTGYARYYHLLPASYADYANPTALGGRLYRWNDQNHDGIFQRGEEGTLLRSFGGPYSAVDAGLKRPFTDEFGFGLEHDIGQWLRMDVQLLQRNTRRLVHTVNAGVPFSAYVPVRVLDPGEDGIADTADDRYITVYNQHPSTLGQDRYWLTNPAGLNAAYRGLEANVTTRLADRGFVSISFTAYKSEGDGNPGNSEFENDAGVVGSLFDNPNTLMNSRGRLFFDRAFVGKIAVLYRAALGFHLGTIISYFDGLPFGRELIIPDFNQGPFFVMATPRGEPGGFRTEYNLNFDQRVAREFEWGRKRVSILLDVFNLLNLNQSLREFDISGPLFSQRRPTDLQNPRAFRLGLRLSF